MSWRRGDDNEIATSYIIQAKKEVWGRGGVMKE